MEHPRTVFQNKSFTYRWNPFLHRWEYWHLYKWAASTLFRGEQINFSLPDAYAEISYEDTWCEPVNEDY